MTALNKEFAAEVLVDAMFTTDEKVCQKYGVSLRSLRRYRQRLGQGDLELAGFVHTKKALRDAAWAEELPACLAQAMQTLESCFSAIQLDGETLKKPETIHAIAGALRILAEVKLTEKLLEARLRGLSSPSTGKYRNISKYTN